MHVDEENAGPAVAIEVGEAGLAAPAMRIQSHFGGNVLEVVVPHVLIKDGMFVAVGVQVSIEGVGDSDVLTIWSFFVVSVLSDVTDQQVDEAVVIVVEEKRAGRVSHQTETGFLRNVLEMSVA